MVSTQNAGTFATLLLGVSMTPHEIGRRIAEVRETRGWTQLDFALEMGRSPSTVQRWEAGKLPRVKTLIEIAEKLELSAEELVGPSRRESDEVVAEQLDRIEQAQSEQGGLLRELLARLDQGGEATEHP